WYGPESTMTYSRQWRRNLLESRYRDWWHRRHRLRKQLRRRVQQGDPAHLGSIVITTAPRVLSCLLGTRCSNLKCREQHDYNQRAAIHSQWGERQKPRAVSSRQRARLGREWDLQHHAILRDHGRFQRTLPPVGRLAFGERCCFSGRQHLHVSSRTEVRVSNQAHQHVRGGAVWGGSNIRLGPCERGHSQL